MNPFENFSKFELDIYNEELDKHSKKKDSIYSDDDFYYGFLAGLKTNEDASSYCSACGSCGEDGCCPAQGCKYPGIKAETVAMAKEITESVCQENIRLRNNDKRFKDLIHRAHYIINEFASLESHKKLLVDLKKELE